MCYSHFPRSARTAAKLFTKCYVIPCRNNVFIRAICEFSDDRPAHRPLCSSAQFYNRQKQAGPQAPLSLTRSGPHYNIYVNASIKRSLVFVSGVRSR